MIPDGEDEYDLPVDQMDAMVDGADAFANVGQGLIGDHKTAMLQYWQQIIDDIERISDDGKDTDVFKSTVLPLARIKKVMKTDSEVRMISAEAPILFAKGCDIFITELTMRAWIHAEENKRRTLQRSDIATAIQKSDVFDFLIDIVPREEAQPRRPSHRMSDVSQQLPPGQHIQQPSSVPGGGMGKPPSMVGMPPPMGGPAPVPIPGMPPGVPPAGRPMPNPSEVPGYPSMANLGTLSNIANLSNLNGMDLAALNMGNIPVPYENMAIPASLGGYPPEMQYAQQAGQPPQGPPQIPSQAQIPQHAQPPPPQPQNSVPDQSRQVQPQNQQLNLPPHHQQQQSHHHQQQQQQQQQAQQTQQPQQQQQQQQNHTLQRPENQSSGDSDPASKSSNKPGQPVRSPQDDEGFSRSPRFENGELQFSSYPQDSVDVSSYGQNF